MIVNTLQRCSSILVLLLMLGSAPVCLAQDTVYARKIVRDLTADEFHGRGYYKGGDSKAADYIAKEFRKLKLQKIHGSYFQNFSLPVNVFSAKVELTIGGQKLTPGEDFIVSPACPPVKGKYGILRMERPYGSFYKMDLSRDFLLIDRTNADSTTKAELDSIIKNPPPAAGLLIPEPKKLTWSVARKVNPYAGIRVLADSFPSAAHDLELEVNSKFIKKYNTQNVIAMIPGTTQPDSFIVFTAHYDHIGRMGRNTIFPGANDNASGVSMVLALAKHYADSANRTGKSLVFILFAAEEAGLVGSEYFVNHPLIPLDKIRFLINMDMMGTGEDGVMVVNGEVHEKEYNILKELNDKNGWLKEVGKRGTAKNSDHHFFSERGVPAFFFYTTGGSKAYHDIYDTHEKLSFAGYSGVFHLITSFVDRVGN